MTSAIVAALLLDVLALSLVRIARLFSGSGSRLASAGVRKPMFAPQRNALLDRIALALSLIAGGLILAWLWLG